MPRLHHQANQSTSMLDKSTTHILVQRLIGPISPFRTTTFSECAFSVPNKFRAVTTSGSFSI